MDAVFAEELVQYKYNFLDRLKFDCSDFLCAQHLHNNVTYSKSIDKTSTETLLNSRLRTKSKNIFSLIVISLLELERGNF